MDKIFIHNDVENLRFFSNKHGISASSDRITHYAMQGSDIVRVFYNKKDAIDYYNRNRYTSDLPIIYFFDQEKFLTETNQALQLLKTELCDNLDENYNCKNMCLTRCVNGNKFYK